MIRYADITINDRNPIKRKLQRVRLKHSLRSLQDLPRDFNGKILDFGAGDALLSTQIAFLFPNAQIVAYEPSKDLQKQALEKIQAIKNITLIEDVPEKKQNKYDFIFCLEVMEHLPSEQMDKALKQIWEASTEKTKIIFGVPNELYLAAFLKGVFRMTRRFGDVDAIPSNIFKASLGFSSKSRPEALFSDNLPYIYRHMGFNYKNFFNTLSFRFHKLETYGSPFPLLPNFFNFEIYIVCKIIP